MDGKYEKHVFVTLQLCNVVTIRSVAKNVQKPAIIYSKLPKVFVTKFAASDNLTNATFIDHLF